LPKRLQQPEFLDLFGKTGNISVPEAQIFKRLYGLAIADALQVVLLQAFASFEIQDIQSIGIADAFLAKLVL